MSLHFCTYITITDLFEPDFNDLFKEQIDEFSDELFQITDGSLAEEPDYEWLAEAGISFPLNVNTKEFKKFEKISIRNFSQKYKKLINFLRKNEIDFGINFGIYDIVD